MKGLTVEQAIKALEEGKKLEFNDDGEWFKSECKSIFDLSHNIEKLVFIYRIKPMEKEVVLYGGLYSFDTYNLWCYDEEKANEGYKITFKVHENNEPTGEIRIERV